MFVGVQNWIAAQNKILLIFAGFGCLMILCMACVFPLGLGVLIGKGGLGLPDVKLFAPSPTATVLPSATPRPTVPPTLPPPTATPVVYQRGTYLVGADLAPGVYRGIANADGSSCYWARYSGLSGNFEDIIENDYFTGPYYFEVIKTDMALESDCSFTPYEPKAVAQLKKPMNIKPGMYMVGVEIEAGRYQGVVGSSFESSCLWQRLKDLKGQDGSVLEYGFGSDTFVVTVQPSDVGFRTKCDLKYIGK